MKAIPTCFCEVISGLFDSVTNLSMLYRRTVADSKSRAHIQDQLLYRGSFSTTSNTLLTRAAGALASRS